MQAIRNLLHALLLALWAVAGLLFTLKVLFGAAAFLAGVGLVASWWLWFGGLVALTTWLVTRFEGALAALAVHGLVFVGLGLLPRVLPFSLLRLGLDLLQGG